MAQSVGLDKDGNVIVDGKTITPGQVDTLVTDVDKAWKIASNHKNWNIKQIEKFGIYAATLVTTTNVFGQVPIPTNVRGWIVGGAAFILAAIHVSTPKAP